MDLSHVTQGTLKNGMRWIAAHDAGAKTVAFQMLTLAGSRMESAGKYGLAHLVEHLMFDGTTKHTAQELVTQLSEYGGQLNAYTTNDMAVYHCKLRPEHVEKMFSFFSEILYESTFSDEAIEREKSVVLQEIAMRLGSPVSKLVMDMLPQKAWQGTPAAEPVGGREKDILSVNRKDVLHFVEAMYRPEQIVLSLAGDLSGIKDLPAILTQYFSFNVKNRAMPTIPLAKSIRQDELITYQMELDQKDAVVAMTFPYMTARLEKYVDVLSNVLMDTMNSRLFIELRTKTGLVYSISPLSTQLRDVGLFGFLFMTENKQEKVTKAANLSLETLNDLVLQGITEVELARAKTYIKEQRLLALEDTMNLASFYGQELLLKGKVRPYQQVIEEVEALTLEDIHYAANVLFSISRLNLAIFT
jgi:predicted Zn-dependent peptidase